MRSTRGLAGFAALSLLCWLLLLSLGCQGPDRTTQTLDEELTAEILAVPDVADLKPTALALTERSRIERPPTPALRSIVERWTRDVERLHGTPLAIAGMNEVGPQIDLTISLDSTLASEAYEITIDERIAVRAGDEVGAAHALTTLTQLSAARDGQLVLPKGYIQDAPEAGYRGVMLDLARAWHSVDTIKQVIDLAAYYKANYLHLHFTDYQSYTLPSAAYPKLPTPGRSYTVNQLRDLIAYARDRGIAVVPEIDLPGHAQAMVEAYPELFGIAARAGNPYIINMGSEAVYAAIETLLGEIAPIFSTSPYLHIGGDEAIFDHVLDDPKTQAYLEQHNLPNDPHALYRHFLVRVNGMVRELGKQTCVWEGFRPEGEPAIPKDIFVFAFETNRYLPQHLVRDGYHVVNTSWKPLYVVNEKKFSAESLYAWNRWRWANWWPRAPSFEPIQVERSPLVIGGEMCSWEQPARVVVPSLRRRWALASERLWNSDATLSLEEVLARVDTIDAKLSILLGDDRQDDQFVGYDYVAEE